MIYAVYIQFLNLVFSSSAPWINNPAQKKKHSQKVRRSGDQQVDYLAGSIMRRDAKDG